MGGAVRDVLPALVLALLLAALMAFQAWRELGPGGADMADSIGADAPEGR